MSKKNRKSKILLSTTLTASAFVSTMNVDASQNTSADKWVKEAENLAGALKWAISVEGKEGEAPEIPWTLYNQTKQAKEKVLEAIKSLPKKERTIYETRLQNNVDLYISTTPSKVGRVVAYIDAITAGKKIAEKKVVLEQKLQKNEIDDATEKAYHELSWELKKQSILLDRVYGQSTRDVIRNHFKKSAEAVKEEALYPVSIKLELDRANEALVKGNKEEANKRLKAADEFLKVALEKGFIEKSGTLFYNLNEKYTLVEQKYEKEVAKENPPASTEPNYSGGGSNNVAYSSPGTYGPSSGVQIITGDVIISSRDVILQNVVIKGNLLISEDVGEGDVRLKNVKVEGQTLVKGGGQNSVYFEDTALATVIVNKNNGAIRIVAAGNTHVAEVQLESYVKIEESHLTNGADGFTDITVSDKVQSTNPGLSVQLVGSFEKIISNASNVRLNLDSQSDIRKLILHAAAEVVADGRIDTAEINVEGSTISSVPQNTVLNNGVTAEVNGQLVTESQYADEAGEMKIVLSWDGQSVNLDSHLVGPSGENSKGFHIYPGNKIFQKDGVNYVDLDKDATQSFGKETTTLRELTDGRYVFYVHNNSESYMHEAAAKVQIFKGNEQVESHTFTNPTEGSYEDYWLVCALDVSNNGQNVEIVPIDLLAPSQNDLRNDSLFDLILFPRQYPQMIIGAAEWEITNAVEGTQPGQYRIGSKAALQAVIDEVKQVVDNPLSTIKECILAEWKMQRAISHFWDEERYPELNGSIVRSIDFTDIDQNNMLSMGDEVDLRFHPLTNLDPLLRGKDVMIQLIDSTTSDTINIYTGSTLNDIQSSNLLLSFSSTQDIISQDTLFAGRSELDESTEDLYRITFGNVLTENHSTAFPDLSKGEFSVSNGEALRNIFADSAN